MIWTKMNFSILSIFPNSTTILTLLRIWVVGWYMCVGNARKLIGLWNSGILLGFIKWRKKKKKKEDHCPRQLYVENRDRKFTLDLECLGFKSQYYCLNSCVTVSLDFYICENRQNIKCLLELLWKLNATTEIKWSYKD